MISFSQPRFILPALLLLSAAVLRGGPPEEIPYDGILGIPAVLPDGTLVALTAHGRSLQKDPQPGETEEEAVIRRSTDGGRTWTPPTRAFSFSSGNVSPNVGRIAHIGYPLVDNQGHIHFFKVRFLQMAKADDPFGNRADLLHFCSRDGGKTWSDAVRVDFGHDFTGALNSAIALKSGRLLLALSYTGQRFISRAKQVELLVCSTYSDDGGRTWRPGQDNLSVPLGPLEGHPGALEPILIELLDGRVWMLIRTQTNRFYESFSADGGATWTTPQASAILAPNSPGAILRLKDGRIALCWNAFAEYPNGVIGGKQGYRQYLYAALSSDEGRTWTKPRMVAPVRNPHSADSRAQYPFMSQNLEGKILLYYGRFAADTNPDAAVANNLARRELVIIDPSWLQALEAK